ncbi:imidazole glycerol phosphate synthase subunit HisH [Candidatus Marinamargulisbacteria bacterium SCGC AG-343-D04]|nr:imidazole glycerol phosphate synthase subunit HisH [Candidatus Marinamargulisbacteria bacterium SCGC AG-343-D04]
MTIAILDYGAGNIRSVQHACSHLGYESFISNNKDELLSASHVIVPGQGAFSQAMTLLKDKSLDLVLRDIIAHGTPFLGICLGFQILFESSDEHGHHEGLGLLPGKVSKIDDPLLNVPHMGWNTVENLHSTMFNAIPEHSHFYFVHSFYIQSTPSSFVASNTTYGQSFVSAVVKDNVWGTQFHPEKSSDAGLQLLRNFLNT